jgi:tetratricopeptide (TPR) repeat protein
MNRTAVVAAAAVAVAFGLITMAKRRNPTAAEDVPSALSPERERVRQFWALYHQANSDRTAGRFDHAIPLFRRALELDPRHEDSLFNLATSLKEIGAYAEATAVLRRLLEVNPASNRGWTELGNTLSTPLPGAPLDLAQARRAFERSIELNREQAGPFLELGRLELNQGDWKEAERHLRIAAGFASPEGNFLTGYALFRQKRYVEAAGFFRKVLDNYAHEKTIAARGVLSEGDILPAPGKPMTALERAAVKSLLFLYWTAVELGRYPVGTPESYKLHTPATAGRRFEHWTAAPGTVPAFPKRCGALPPEAARRGAITDCVAADFDGDGNKDLFVVYWLRPAALFLTRGGALHEATAEVGLQGIRERSFSAAALDYDRDGRLDLFLSCHAPFEETVRGLVQPGYRAPRFTPRLFRNAGGAKFQEVTGQAGLRRCYGTMQALPGDFDGDGWTDLLLVNGSLDGLRLEPSVILRNQQGKTFVEWAWIPSFDRPGNYVGAEWRGGVVTLLSKPER